MPHYLQIINTYVYPYFVQLKLSDCFGPLLLFPLLFDFITSFDVWLFAGRLGWLCSGFGIGFVWGTGDRHWEGLMVWDGDGDEHGWQFPRALAVWKLCAMIFVIWFADFRPLPGYHPFHRHTSTWNDEPGVLLGNGPCFMLARFSCEWLENHDDDAIAAKSSLFCVWSICILVPHGLFCFRAFQFECLPLRASQPVSQPASLSCVNCNVGIKIQFCFHMHKTEIEK